MEQWERELEAIDILRNKRSFPEAKPQPPDEFSALEANCQLVQRGGGNMIYGDPAQTLAMIEEIRKLRGVLSWVRNVERMQAEDDYALAGRVPCA